MLDSGTVAMDDSEAEKRVRGKGRGSNFFALGHEVKDQLWSMPTTNRLNLVIAYLVLLAGTGSDHRLTKWSAKACEEYTGLGKPRAKHAIGELVASGLVKRTDASSRMMPQYELPPLAIDAEPVFLPVALVTGLSGEASMLRRVRETGDAMALRMLIDLYGLISLDATHGIPLEHLRGGLSQNDEPNARKLADVGAHGVWGITRGSYRGGGGEWASFHRAKAKDSSVAWKPFWERLDLLKQIGAVWYEPWLFDSAATDAEPIIPLDPSGYYPVAEPDDEARLTRSALDAARTLVGEEREYLFERADFYVPLTLHRQTPAYREVARLRVEADTPGRRLSWKRRRIIIEQYQQAFDQLRHDALEGRFDRPMQLGSTLEPAL